MIQELEVDITWTPYIIGVVTFKNLPAEVNHDSSPRGSSQSRNDYDRNEEKWGHACRLVA
jgi:hypothetical protein